MRASTLLLLLLCACPEAVEVDAGDATHPDGRVADRGAGTDAAPLDSAGERPVVAVDSSVSDASHVDAGAPDDTVGAERRVDASGVDGTATADAGGGSDAADAATDSGAAVICPGEAPLCQELAACQERWPGTLALVDQALLQRLEGLTQGNLSLDYDAESKDYLYGTYAVDGLDEVEGGVYCLYTGQVLEAGYNCEHLWPRSDFDEANPMLGDLHHLLGVSADANSRRGNLHFGDVQGDGPEQWDWPQDCPCEDPDPKRCCSVLGDAAAEGVSKAFEPRHDAKGDIARALLYFATRYRSRDINLSRTQGTGPAPANRIPAFEEEALRRWHHDDPVSERESARSQRIFEIQGNRNPFIDCPALVERISDF